MGVLPKKDNERSENKMISLEPKPIAWGFHRLKQLSGLSYICNLAKYDFNFKQYLSCIYQGQIWKHICPTFVIFTTRTNKTSCICPKAKYDQIHYFTQCKIRRGPVPIYTPRREALRVNCHALEHTPINEINVTKKSQFDIQSTGCYSLWWNKELIYY